MEPYQLYIFIANIPLILLDAAIGYHLSPRLMAGFDEETARLSVRSTRGMLTAVVALYMFFNCLGYFRDNSTYLLTVTGLVVIDMALQLWLGRKRPQRDDDGNGVP